MNKVMILSRDVTQYKHLIKQANLPGLELTLASDRVEPDFDYSRVDIIFGDPNLTSQVVTQCHNLKWLQSTWAGNAELFSTGKTDYQLCGVKDVFGAAMREYIFAYVLYFSRNIQRFRQTQSQHKWSPPTYDSLAGSAIGIMGVGNIGKSIAQIAKSFEMETRGMTKSSNECEFIDKYYSLEQLDSFAAGLDYLVCLLPESPETHLLIDAHFLARLPKNCVFINAGRGSNIVDSDLISALRSNQLKAAVLDVFHQEPLPKSHPFWRTDNVYITQHTAAESKPDKIVQLFINNYQRFINGTSLENKLDFAKGY